MAELPDLDTGNIGFCAYWNAIDQGGVGAIQPEDALSDGNIVEYTLYDNGWEADIYELTNGREAKLRVKNDGWFVAYLDGRENYDTQVDDYQSTLDTVRGPWDIADDWTDSNSLSSFQQDSLSSAIQNAASNLGNFNLIEFNYGDVGMYNFDYTGATGFTGMSSFAGERDEFTSGFLYTEGTTLEMASIAGHNREAAVTMDGAEIIPHSQQTFTSKDLISSGIVTDPGTEYTFQTGTGEYEHSHIALITIWS